MTGRLKSMDEENEIESDWKFAAMVIDRSRLKALASDAKVSLAPILVNAWLVMQGSPC